MNHIKVNFPATQEDYENGNGEGMFVLVDDEIKAAYDSDATGGVYSGILDNDSLYYPGLKHGARVPFEMRGEYRPVCPIDWLKEHYGAGDSAKTGNIGETVLVIFDILNRALFDSELKRPGFIVDDISETDEEGITRSGFFVLPYTSGEYQPFITINTYAMRELVERKQEESLTCALAATLLHEMTNYYCFLHGIESYKEERFTEGFRDAARAHGLECEWSDLNGWGKTEISGYGWESIARVLDDETAETLGWF